MKKIIFLIAVVLSLKATSQNAPLPDSVLREMTFAHYEGLENPNVVLKHFTAKGDDGRTYTNNDLKGKATFMNFWFQECAPCMAEMDELNAFYKKYKNEKDFQFLSFTYEKDEVIEHIKNQYHIEYPILHMDGRELQNFHYGLGYPTTMILDQTGKITFIKSGGPIDAKVVQQDFSSIFSKQMERVLYRQ